MKILIDDANLDKIKAIYDMYPVDGVTCNPTILKKEKGQPYQVLRSIREYIGQDAHLHVQVVANNAEEMIKEAIHICQVLGENTFIKIPVIPEGLKAMKILSQSGFHLTGTAIYSAMQGYLAAKAGAEYVAPYVNRMDNLGYDGIEVSKQLNTMIKSAGLSTKVLAASFKNNYQIQELCVAGIDAVTISTDLIHTLASNPTITHAVDTFTKDFESLCGPNKTMLNCE